MSGRHGLSAGKLRMLGSHQGREGRWYAECWAGLSELTTLEGLLRLEAGRVCVLWVAFRAATEVVQEAKRARRDGRGRKPGGRDLERLSRRQGLSDASFSQALDRFRELADKTKQRKPTTPADLVERLRAGGMSR